MTSAELAVKRREISEYIPSKFLEMLSNARVEIESFLIHWTENNLGSVA